MILVRKRGELASLIVARLHAEGVPVAGVDRLRLDAPLAVQDLLAAIRFALQPRDDLALASLLVSPLIGWSQDAALMLAHGRDAARCWAHLRPTRARRERLDRCSRSSPRPISSRPIVSSRRCCPGRSTGGASCCAGWAQEARDPIEELLNAALTVRGATARRRCSASSTGSIAARCEIKRDPSAPLDAVRVMTVHGAKGLQAPLVILADATGDPDASPGGGDRAGRPRTGRAGADHPPAQGTSASRRSTR